MIQSMTPEQQEHLAGIVRRFVEDLTAKYTRGQAQHQGNLWEKPGMLKMLRQEHLDSVAYDDSLQYQIQSALDYLLSGDSASCAKVLTDILGEPTDK